MSKKILEIIKENRGFIIFLVLMGVFRSSLADWNSVPTGSMKPTIIEGDRILINKLAYDVKLPFSNISIAELSQPQRGDIIIFNSAMSKKRLVKRVIGVPGDSVSMLNNRLTINGVELEYTLSNSTLNAEHSSDLDEDLLGVKHQIRIDNKAGPAANFLETRVPENMYLALGDNRDNSVDSRYIGFVPRSEIIGRSNSVVMSFDYDDYYLLRKERFFKTL